MPTAACKSKSLSFETSAGAASPGPTLENTDMTTLTNAAAKRLELLRMTDEQLDRHASLYAEQLDNIRARIVRAKAALNGGPWSATAVLSPSASLTINVHAELQREEWLGVIGEIRAERTAKRSAG